MNKRSRRAFTLFQLLIVLAVLAILIGLLLPAVQKVREAAARMQSQNNMKQIGIACHNYHDVYGALPPGTDDKHFSAAARLLPYIEQDNLYKTIDFKKPADDKANAEARAIIIKTYLSPLDPVLAVSPDAGATNYLFNAGAKYPLKDNDGLFYLDSKVKFADVTDGLSNTLLTGETLKGAPRPRTVQRQYVGLPAAALAGLTEESGVKDFKDGKNARADRCAAWIDGRFLQGTFTGTRVLNDPRPDVSCGGAGGLSALRNVRDYYTNIGMADGSVRVIHKEVKLEVWKNLASRNDGNPIPEF